MSALSKEYGVILEQLLDREFVANLPPLLVKTKSKEEDERKNRSRAFSAFALRNLCEVSSKVAAQSVIDDYDDFGVDAIYYHAQSETLYLVQSKLKESAQFSQAEALAFCQGVRKLMNQDFTGFNANVQNRLQEIEDALDN
ncbi:MAG: abortive phage resistance protein, partial [Gammaproteobacteria bacterium]|nr:abortive phage resistance protein [Gammaproteobacteria bacterium]